MTKKTAHTKRQGKVHLGRSLDSEDYTEEGLLVCELLKTLGVDPANITSLFVDAQWITLISYARDKKGNRVNGKDGQPLRDIKRMAMRNDLDTGAITWLATTNI